MKSKLDINHPGRKTVVGYFVDGPVKKRKTKF